MLWDTGVCNVSQWKIASEISMLLVWAMKEPKAITELNLMPQKHKQLIKSALQRIQDCFKCGGPHCQNKCMKHRDQPSKRSHSTSYMQQNCNRNDNSHKFHDNRKTKSMLPMGALSFQASQQIKSGDDISLSINPIKCFPGKIDKK